MSRTPEERLQEYMDKLRAEEKAEDAKSLGDRMTRDTQYAKRNDKSFPGKHDDSNPIEYFSPEQKVGGASDAERNGGYHDWEYEAD